MPRFAIRYPYLIIVCCLMTVVIGVASLVRMPVDLFPEIKIPVVVVATFYNGMPPEQIETSITSRFERFFTLAGGVDHMESRSLAGVSIIRVYFQPGMNADTAVTTIGNLAAANLRRLPPGTLPPVVLKFDASSLPVCLITFQGEGLNETQLRDNAQYTVRNQVANVPGASVPQPFGGRYRQIQVYVDPVKLEARQLSVMDVVRAVNDSNLILPAGDVRIGPIDYNLYANAQLPSAELVNRVPLKTLGQTSVLVGDVGQARDASQIQYNSVRVDGQRSVYLPVLKQGGDANTISVVSGIKQAVAHLLDVPAQLKTSVVFDQSVFVKTAIENLIHEGVLGLVLTGIMILVFLGSPKATLAVFLSIPLSALATFIALSLGGGTVNTMILGGLALAFSRLIDNSVMVLENIFRHLELGEAPRAAAEKGGSEVSLAVLAASLSMVVVFFPVTFLYGVGRFLFSALALSVVLSLGASYLVAMTVVPVFCAYLVRAEDARHESPHADSKGANAGAVSRWSNRFRSAFNRQFHAMLDGYEAALGWALDRPRLTVWGILGVFVLSLGLFPFVGTAFFPRTDPGQFVINLKAPTGSNLESTEKLVARVEQVVREEVSTNDLRLIVSNLGVTPDFSALYTPNSGQHTAFVQASLNENHRGGSYQYMDRVRDRLHRELPQLSVYLQSGGLVDAILNLGLPAPLDLQISATDLRLAHRTASDLASQIRALPGVADALIPQDVDYPALRLDIDRERAAALGLSQKEVMENVITALTSDGMVAPSYWVDPVTGNDYLLTVQYPENYIRSVEDLKAIPLRGPAQADPTRLDSVTRIRRTLSPTEVDHYQLRRTIDIFVAPTGEDLSAMIAGVEGVLKRSTLPPAVRVAMRGSVQGMRRSFSSFGLGLTLSVVLVYLILVAQFQSFIDPLLILLAVPVGLTGVLAMLWATDTTLNIMSLMGVVMMVGIVVSDSIMIVEFTNRLRADGMPLRQATSRACRVRLRPVMMTTLATLIGLIPMALKLGAGSEAYAPLARAIIGGLALSAAQTVFLVPAAYLLLHRKSDEKEAE